MSSGKDKLIKRLQDAIKAKDRQIMKLKIYIKILEEKLKGEL